MYLHNREKKKPHTGIPRGQWVKKNICGITYKKYVQRPSVCTHESHDFHEWNIFRAHWYRVDNVSFCLSVSHSLFLSLWVYIDCINKCMLPIRSPELHCHFQPICISQCLCGAMYTSFVCSCYNHFPPDKLLTWTTLMLLSCIKSLPLVALLCVQLCTQSRTQSNISNECPGREEERERAGMRLTIHKSLNRKYCVKDLVLSNIWHGNAI